MTFTNLLMDAAKFGWCLFLTLMLLRPIRRGTFKRDFYVFRQITPIIALQNLLILAAVITTCYLLWQYVPILNLSWIYLLPGFHHRGSAADLLSDHHHGSNVMNIMVLPLTIRYFGLIFLVLFGLNLPALARNEELRYRLNTKDWRQGVKRSIQFGLAHCIVGVPLFVGLALSIGGLWFTYQYFKGGVERSTLHHTTYNLLVLMVAFIAVLQIAFGAQ